MYITANVPMIEKGRARLGMTVAQTLRRKTKITMMTSASVRSMVNWTSRYDSRIVPRRAVGMGDDRVLALVGRHQRAGRLQRAGLVRPDDRAGRGVDVPRAQRRL